MLRSYWCRPYGVFSLAQGHTDASVSDVFPTSSQCSLEIDFKLGLYSITLKECLRRQDAFSVVQLTYHLSAAHFGPMNVCSMGLKYMDFKVFLQRTVSLNVPLQDHINQYLGEKKLTLFTFIVIKCRSFTVRTYIYNPTIYFRYLSV